MSKLISEITRKLLEPLHSAWRKHLEDGLLGKGNARYIPPFPTLLIPFTYTGFGFPKGTKEHPPHTDLEEVRQSITVRFFGTPDGTITAHLFHDGTIKTAAMMHAEVNARRAEVARLQAEESQFPDLNQTPLREEAERRKLAVIRVAREHPTWSVIQKQLHKSNAVDEFKRFLREQAQQRATSGKK